MRASVLPFCIGAHPVSRFIYLFIRGLAQDSRPDCCVTGSASCWIFLSGLTVLRRRWPMNIQDTHRARVSPTFFACILAAIFWLAASHPRLWWDRLSWPKSDLFVSTLSPILAFRNAMRSVILIGMACDHRIRPRHITAAR